MRQNREKKDSGNQHCDPESPQSQRYESIVHPVHCVNSKYETLRLCASSVSLWWVPFADDFTTEAQRMHKDTEKKNLSHQCELITQGRRGVGLGFGNLFQSTSREAATELSPRRGFASLGKSAPQSASREAATEPSPRRSFASLGKSAPHNQPAAKRRQS
jgi:hypothetical protein